MRGTQAFVLLFVCVHAGIIPGQSGNPDSNRAPSSSTDGTSGETRFGPSHAPALPRSLSSGTHVAGFAAFAEVPALLLGVSVDALVLFMGPTFKYDGNGLPDAMGAPTTDKTSSGLTLAASYLFLNRYPVGIGPGVSYGTEFAPGSVFDQQTITAGANFYFAPFPAPVILITQLASRVTLAKGRDPVFELITPSLLIGYAIR